MIDNTKFSEKTVSPNPFIQFRAWYVEHMASETAIPESVTLATSSKDGRVSARTVLLKGFNDKGFIFFTNYKSKKGNQLLSNPMAALLFYWQESGRQVRIEGITEKVSEEDSESYFKTRPRESQISAWASEQSSTIPDRDHLNDIFTFYTNKFADKPVSKPPHWGGFLLVPEWFEFWQNGEFRLHDRLTYSKRKDTWIIERLAP